MATRRVWQGGRTSDQCRLCAGGGKGRGDGVALFAGGPVADEPYRVDCFIGGAGRHQRFQAGERAGREEPKGSRDDVQGFGKPSVANLAAGEIASTRTHDVDTTRAQGGDIGLDRWMCPHDGIHRRGDQDRPVIGEECCGGKIVGQPMGHLADDVGGGGRHQDQIGFPHQPDMAHLGLKSRRDKLPCTAKQMARCGVKLFECFEFHFWVNAQKWRCDRLAHIAQTKHAYVEPIESPSK